MKMLQAYIAVGKSMAYLHYFPMMADHPYRAARWMDCMRLKFASELPEAAFNVPKGVMCLDMPKKTINKAVVTHRLIYGSYEDCVYYTGTTYLDGKARYFADFVQAEITILAPK